MTQLRDYCFDDCLNFIELYEYDSESQDDMVYFGAEYLIHALTR